MKHDTVVMVASQLPPIYGGAGQQAMLLASRLVERGWTVHAVSLDQDGVGDTTDLGVRVHRHLAGMRPTSFRSRFATTVCLSLAAAFRTLILRPRVVHIHGAYWWSILPALTGRITGSRVVLKVTRDGEDDPQTVMGRRALGIHVGAIYGLSFRLATDVVLLSDSAYRAAVDAGLQKKAVRLNNGVDGRKFYRTPTRHEQQRSILNVPQGRTVFLFVGYLVEHKGILDLLDAWAHVRERCAADLWLVGPYGDFYRELDSMTETRVTGAAAQDDSVKVFGAISSNELPDLYAAADVFVLPSYREGMPNSLAEAMVSGCTIVATQIPGITDLVRNSKMGYLVQPGDPVALADAMIEAANKSTFATSSDIETIDIDGVTARYEDLYRGQL